MPISGENQHFKLIRCEDTQAWLEQRKAGVGGSDVAAIMGLSPWRTPLQVWLEKTGHAAETDLSDKPYVQFGNIMEPLIGDWFSKKHPDFTVRRVNAICQSIERPWAQASLDYEVKCGLVWGVLEIKTARTMEDWKEGVPPYYLTQITHYMSVTNRPFAYVAVFFRDSCEFAEYYVEYDPEDGAAVKGAVDTFWHEFVEADVMPEVVGTSGEAASLATYYGKGAQTIRLVLDETASGAISDYQDAADRERKAKDDKAKAATRLIALIGEDKGIETDVAIATWVRSERESFDTKRLKAEHPDIYAQYAKRQVVNGGIRIKEIK